MADSNDPSQHRGLQDRFIQHVERLLEDDRLRLDTTRGRRPATSFIRDVNRGDKTVDLTRLMSEMNKPDRDLRNRMPIDRWMDVSLSRQRWFFLKQPVGKMKVVCVSPSRQLLDGSDPPSMSRGELTDLLRQTPANSNKVPETIVVMSSSGFAIEANELAQRSADRTVILVAPNKAGGWSMIGPPETKALADLFDPEAEDAKRLRIRSMIEEARVDLSGSGVAADRIAAATQLPPTLVEAELKLYARENAGLAAKRLDGKMVLFRQAAAPVASGGIESGGSNMPFIERMKTLFARKGETEKKIAFLSERRAALSQQRDRGYEEMGALESRESDLRTQFKESNGEITKRRITSQLLQLRKDIERRQQLLGVLNQQINVVATHLHNLELVQQGKTAQLPDSEDMAKDAAAAEDMIAELQVSSELADTVGSTAPGGMSAEEQALYEELEKGPHPAESEASVVDAPAPTAAKVSEAAKPADQSSRQRATPEAG